MYVVIVISSLMAVLYVVFTDVIEHIMHISSELLLWRVHVTKILVVCLISCATLVIVLYSEHDGETQRK